MKKLILAAFLFLTITCISQDYKKIYSKIHLSRSIDDHFSKYYKRYTSKYFYETTGKRRIIERDPVLDTVAAGRSEYSMIVFRESSKHDSFSYLLSNVPDGESAHKRYYGNPSIFREPRGCIFPNKNNLDILKRNGLTWSSELFVQCSYSFKTSNGSMENRDILQKYMNYLRKETDFSSEDTFLKSYLGSQPHKNAIRKHGNWKFGCSTMFLIAKQFNKSSDMWKYEVFTCNTLIIVKNFTDSNVY
jgi:hypothetical protein